MKRFAILMILSLFLVAGIGVYTAQSWTPVPVTDDPLVRMPGTQPNQIQLEGPTRCLNCHAGYNTAIEPGYNWQGSMMAQAARDFIYWACITVAGQDSIWAAGRPNAVDICERCHFPKGWLEGRSDPTNASAMTGEDFDGVQCDFCHRMWDPFFEGTYTGQREGSDWLNYWDETNASSTPSQPAADATYIEDKGLSAMITTFNGSAFFGVNSYPFSSTYTENGSGQYFVSPNSAKRASFADAAARHQMFYSRHHKSKYICGNCHDVSNPVLANLGSDPTQALPTELKSASSYFHVERTFSEFMLSAYGQQGGSPGKGPFSPDVFYTNGVNNNISKCQDCHMRDLQGVGCNKTGAPNRPSGSTEHPKSGQPVHDLTGGNAFVSYVLASAVPGSPNYDSINASLLNQGPAVLTLDMGAGLGVDPVALLAGSERAKQQLQLAASIENVSYDAATGALSFRVQNQSGHKLISGFPEGRRMFLNVKAYQGGQLIYEVNPYDYTVGTLKGLPASYSSSSPALGANEVYKDAMVYEMHPSSTLTGELETFHFALADGRYKDNRIPPKGFDADNAAARQSLPVWEGQEDKSYYTESEYAGGYDDVSTTIATGADSVEINLYYQTTSREYIEFLRDEINGNATTLAGPGAGGDPAYLIQTDPFFSGLKAWGSTIWQLWDHNKNVPGAAPFLMTQATLGGGGGGCAAPTPQLLSATAGNQSVQVTWSDEHSGDPGVTGYVLYYDQAGKSQLVADLAQVITYNNTGLTNGQQYCYKVTSKYAGCESPASNILCATPSPGSNPAAGVDTLETGYYQTTGKGKSQTTTFVFTASFTAGDKVVIRAYVDDEFGSPIPGAVVDLAISGPETASISSSQSDAQGMAEATWQTHSPNKRGTGGTTPGTYAATVTNVTASGYTWDGFPTEATFVIQ